MEEGLQGRQRRTQCGCSAGWVQLNATPAEGRRYGQSRNTRCLQGAAQAPYCHVHGILRDVPKVVRGITATAPPASLRPSRSLLQVQQFWRCASSPKHSMLERACWETESLW